MAIEKQFKRVFLLEPNLKKSFGHVAEFPLSINASLLKSGFEPVVVCNREADNYILSEFKNIYPVISYGCFEKLNDKGITFSRDLMEIDKSLHFTKSDLIIILTAYINEISGINIFISQLKDKNSPHFAIWLHQIFPPTKKFSDTLKPEFRNKISVNLAKAFRELRHKEEIHIFTTMSEKLRDKYKFLSGKSVGMLSLPYDYRLYDGSLSDIDGTPTFGFLGDGRYEKGLLLIFKLIIQYNDHENNYVIQDIFPRGYLPSEMTEYRKLKSKIITNYKNVRFISDPLGGADYRKVFNKIDCFIMPYHPRSYDKRVSGVFVEALINAKTIITSKGTWLGEEVNKYRCGTTFSYSKNILRNLYNLKTAQDRIIKKYNYFRKNSKFASKNYMKNHNSNRFIYLLLNNF